MSKIFESVLSLSGFEKGGFKYQSILDCDASAFSFLPEKIELDFLKTIEEALQIEPLIPEEDKIVQIQNQVQAFKKGLKERVFALFNELSETWIDESVNLSFIRFELGSRSVMSVWAKNVLGEDQVEHVLERWDSLLNRENDVVLEITNTENDVVKRNKLLCFVFDLTREISKQYRLLLSINIQNSPELTERLIELNELFSSEIIKEMN